MCTLKSYFLAHISLLDCCLYVYSIEYTLYSTMHITCKYYFRIFSFVILFGFDWMLFLFASLVNSFSMFKWVFSFLLYNLSFYDKNKKISQCSKTYEKKTKQSHSKQQVHGFFEIDLIREFLCTKNVAFHCEFAKTDLYEFFYWFFCPFDQLIPLRVRVT